jgi:hypothetical protein
MGQRLRARLERLLRPSHDVPEGADTTGQRCDLPHGGPGLIIPPASARPSAVAAELADDAIDRDWDELLTWAHASLPERIPAETGERMPVVPAVSLPVLPAERVAALPAQPVVDPQDALDQAQLQAAPTTELEEDAEWAACLARAKALTSAPAAAANDDDEWEWALSLARAKAQTTEPANAESDEWASSISRAKARAEAKREQTKQRDEAEWRTSIARAKARTARAFG